MSSESGTRPSSSSSTLIKKKSEARPSSRGKQGKGESKRDSDQSFIVFFPCECLLWEFGAMLTPMIVENLIVMYGTLGDPILHALTLRKRLQDVLLVWGLVIRGC
jgi:hypothetical protein